MTARSGGSYLRRNGEEVPNGSGFRERTTREVAEAKRKADAKHRPQPKPTPPKAAPEQTGSED